MEIDGEERWNGMEGMGGKDTGLASWVGGKEKWVGMDWYCGQVEQGMRMEMFRE